MNNPIWDTSAWDGLPVLAGRVQTDVCVVGLGGSGLSCLEELAGRGIAAIGIDAGKVGGGAAGRNGGFLLAGSAAFYHHSIETLGREKARETYAATLAEIDRLVERWPEVVRRTGSLRIAASPEEEQDCR
ncbi:MAG: FAD-dependent oxidoreductase, partial [Acidobacteriota bacterium]